MPYKDPEKQRQAILKAVKRHRSRKTIERVWKTFPRGYNDPLTVWMKLAQEGWKTELRLIDVDEFEFAMPVTSLDSFLKGLRETKFPARVDVWTKKFVIECVEIEENGKVE
jgi:hypothetical protein